MRKDEKLKKFIKTSINEFLNENVSNQDFLNGILEVFKKNTEYRSEIYPNKRYAFIIDTPSADTVYFRTRYFGDWKENIQACFTGGDNFFRIIMGDSREKTTDFDKLGDMLKNLHDVKKAKHGNYLCSEYSDELALHNSGVMNWH